MSLGIIILEVDSFSVTNEKRVAIRLQSDRRKNLLLLPVHRIKIVIYHYTFITS